MSDPIAADFKPVVLELEEGSYWWCRCGRSKNQPWCDGSHKGTGLEPMEVEITEARNYALCACKGTGNSPFCDGSHTALKKAAQSEG